MKVTSLLLIICLLFQSCSFRWSDIHRGPSSEEVENGKYDDLKDKFSRLKIKILGSEKDKKCSKKNIERDFQAMMASLKKDSCKESEFKLDKEDFMEKACPKIKTEGALDRIAKKIMAQEKGSSVNFSNSTDGEFQKIFKEALALHHQMKSVAMDDSIDSNEKVDVISSYIDNVLLPFRDLVIIKRVYQARDKNGSEYLNQLLPVMSSTFAKELNNEQLGMLTQGPNPQALPFYLNLEESKNHDYFYLDFSPADIIKRDLLALLKAPTPQNYVMALKWMTLHLMLSQIYIYDTILQSKAPLPIPNSCQNQFNGNLPSQFEFKFQDGAGEQFLESILANHGLIFKENDSSYTDYYVDNVSKDPTKDGYSGMIPFENYKNAIWSQSGKSAGALEAQFDDVAHFETILNVKKGEADSKFKDVANDERKGEIDLTYKGFDLFQKILGTFQPDEIGEIKGRKGVKKQIYPGKQNLSTYLFDLMKKNGVDDFRSLISPRLKKKFEGKRIAIDFPSMYSSPIWRDWGLKTLADFTYKHRNDSTSTPLYQWMRLSCAPGYISNNDVNGVVKKICGDEKGKLSQLSNFLAEFRSSGDTYIPTRRLEEKKFQAVYPLLSLFWKNVRDNTDLLLEAKPYEFNFLMDQMAAGNPWARLKLSYEIALDQLEHKREGVAPVFEVNGYWFNLSFDQKNKCSSKLVETQYDRLKEAGKVFGLDRQLTYNFAGKFLSSSEKEYVWKKIVDDFEQRNAQLFSVARNGKTYYSIAENVSAQTILNTSEALRTGAPISKKTEDEIGEVGKTIESQLANYFLRLYKMKRNIEKQKDLFLEFSKLNGIDNTFNLKLNFLAVDENYKKPIYKDLLRQAAHTRKLQIVSQLNSFCSMSVNDHREFKKIFYSTTKAQNEMNQAAGLPGVPEDVMAKLNEMTKEETRDMWLGIGSGVAGMAAIVIGGACTFGSGGLCLPIGGTLAVAGASSLGIQAYLAPKEFSRYLEGKIDSSQIKKMEELGFANTGSNEEVSRSLAWTAVEAMSIFPLIGVASRSVSLGPKLALLSVKSLAQKTGKEAFKAAAKSIIEQEDVRMARYVLRLDSTSKNLSIDPKEVEIANEKIAKLKVLYHQGEIDLTKLTIEIAKALDPIKQAKLVVAKTMKAEIGEVGVLESKEAIDKQAANVVSSYFNNNPREMLQVVSSYAGERLDRAVRVMSEMNSTKRIGDRIPIYRGVRNWFQKMRNEKLALNATKLLRIEKELKTLKNTPEALNNFIVKNIDDLTDIFIDIPMRKREIPYVIQIQGMPMMSFLGGRKIPFLSAMSEGQILKKIFQARARLVYESFKREARSTLKLGSSVKALTAYKAFQGFQLSIAETASQMSVEESKKLVTQYEKIESDIAQKLFKDYLAKGNQTDLASFKKLVFNPSNMKERAIAESIFESVKFEEILNMKEVNEVAHIAVQELANYDDVDSFERYLSALKIITINRDPTILEIM